MEDATTTRSFVVVRVARAQNAQTRSALAAVESARKHVAFWSVQAYSSEFFARAVDDFAHFDVLMAARPYLASDLSDQILLARAFARCLLAWRHRSKDGRPDLCERRPPDVEDEVSLVIGATNE